MPSESSSPPLCSPDSHCLLSRIMLLSPTNAKTSATVVSIPMICHEAVPRGQEERLTQKDFKAARVPRQSGVGAPVHAILDRRGATRCISLYIFAFFIVRRHLFGHPAKRSPEDHGPLCSCSLAHTRVTIISRPTSTSRGAVRKFTLRQGRQGGSVTTPSGATKPIVNRRLYQDRAKRSRRGG